MDIQVDKESVLRYTGTLFKIFKKTTWRLWKLGAFTDVRVYSDCCVKDFQRPHGATGGRRVILDVTPDGVEVADYTQARNVFKRMPHHSLKYIRIKRLDDDYHYLIVVFEERGWFRQKLVCFIIGTDDLQMSASDTSDLSSDDLSQLSSEGPISRREIHRIEESFLSPSSDNSRCTKRRIQHEETLETTSLDGRLYETALAFPNDTWCGENSLQHQNSWASGRGFAKPDETYTLRRPSCRRSVRRTTLSRLNESPESPSRSNTSFPHACSSAPLNRNSRRVANTSLNSTHTVCGRMSTPGRLNRVSENRTSRHGTEPETLESFQLNDSQWTPDSTINA